MFGKGGDADAPGGEELRSVAVASSDDESDVESDSSFGSGEGKEGLRQSAEPVEGGEEVTGDAGPLLRRAKDEHARRKLSTKRKLRAVFFLTGFAFSIYMPFIVLYFKNSVGLSAGQVGLIAALQIVGGYLVGPPISLLVDRYRVHKAVWMASLVLCIAPVECITLAHSFSHAVAVAVSISCVTAPMSSLQDSCTLCFLGPESHQYGRIRLWGAVGWGLGSLAGGSIVEWVGMQYAFHLYALTMLAVAATVSSLDFASIEMAMEASKRSAAAPGTNGGGEGDSFWRSVRRLIPDLSYLFFLFVAVVAGFGATSLQSLLLMFLSDLGAPDILQGLMLSVATVSELPIFWASGSIIKKYGAASLLCASMAAFAVRATLVSFLRNPWMVLPLQVSVITSSSSFFSLLSRSALI